MTKVLFTEHRIVKDEKFGTSEQVEYEAGKVYDLPLASVQRWVSRGIATEDPDMIKAAEEKLAEEGKEKEKVSSRRVAPTVAAATAAAAATTPATAAAKADDKGEEKSEDKPLTRSSFSLGSNSKKD